MPVILALWRLRQDNSKSKASLDYERERERETGKGGKEDKEEIKNRGISFKGHVFNYFIMNYILLRQGLLYLGCPKSLYSCSGFGTCTLLPLPLNLGLQVTAGTCAPLLSAPHILSVLSTD